MEEFIKLLSQYVPVFVGGLITVICIVLTQLLIYYLNRKKSQHDLIIKKSEEIVEALFSYERWIAKKRSCLFRKKEFNENSPLIKVHVLLNLYFPKHRTELIKIIEIESSIKAALHDVEIKQVQEPEKWIDYFDKRKDDELTNQHIESIYKLIYKIAGL